MNENARLLYEDLKEGRLEKFSMTKVEDECGSPLCIVGHAAARFFVGGGIDNLSHRPVYEWLGLTPEIGDELCYPTDPAVTLNYEPAPFWDHVANPYFATQQQAAEALRRACELSTREER